MQKVLVSGCDIDGLSRGKIISEKKLASSSKDGFGFCSVVFGWDLHDGEYLPKPPIMQRGGFEDILAVIDLNSKRLIPWNFNLPHYLVDFYDPRTRLPLPFCPRSLLKRVCSSLNDSGLSAKAGMELEFFNFKETSESLNLKKGVGLSPLTHGMFGYSINRPFQNNGFFNQLYDDCLKYGIPLECFHTETGPGVYEAAIEYADALELADRAHLFKSAAKQIGASHGIIPCFMAKPYVDQPGCSGHIHISLVDSEGFNIFANGASISDTMRHFVAGVLKGLDSIMAILAPTINR
jgi:glutamine synthetase